MKAIIFCAVSIMFLTQNVAWSAPQTNSNIELLRVVGDYQQKKEITYSGYDLRKCEIEGGQWANNICYLPELDEVKISAISGNPDVITVRIATIGNNGNSCDYEGDAILEGNSIVSVEGKCQVTLTFPSVGFTAKVVQAGECNCGAGTSLNIDKARKVIIIRFPKEK